MRTDEVMVSKSPPFWKRFAKALIRQRILLINPGTTANEYVNSNHDCLALTYELSASVVEPNGARALGRDFARCLGRLAEAQI